MKRIILFVLVFFTAITAIAQPPIVRAGPANTVEDYNLWALRAFRTPVFQDTAAANASTPVLDSCGRIIYTYDYDGFWQRACFPVKHWVQINKGGESSIFGCYTLVSGGIVTWSGTGLILDISPATYIINCKTYNSPQTQVTLSTADPSLNRIDLIVGDTLGHIVVITGVPAAPAVKPQANPSSQIEFTSITVSAGATTPSGVTQTIVYNENTEWTSTNALSSGTVNFNSTLNPFNGTINALLTNANGQIYWTNSTPVNSSSYTSLKLYIRVSSGGANPAVNVFVNSSGGGVSPAPVSATVYGFNPSLRDVYQVITIPISNVVTGSFNRVGLVIVSSQVMNVDYVQLQGGIPTGNNPWVIDVFKKYPTDSVFEVKNGINTFAFKDSIGSPSFVTDNFKIYNVPFAPTSFSDSTLVSQLKPATNYYFNKGMWLNGTSTAAIDSSRIIMWNYGYAINDTYSQSLVFKVGDSATSLKIGIGIQADQLSFYLAANTINATNYIDCIIGDSASSSMYNNGYSQSISRTGLLINKGDYIELQYGFFEDSVVFYFTNLTNGISYNLVRKINYGGTTQYNSIYGYPTLFFTKGNLNLLNWSIKHNDFDYLFLGASITQGYVVDSIQYGFVNQLKNYTTAQVTNATRAASYTLDYSNVKNEFNIRNKVVFLSAVYGLGPWLGRTYAQTKQDYLNLVTRLRLNNNKIVHIDAQYRVNYFGAGGWPEINQLNNWLDTAFHGIDTIVHTVNYVFYPADYYVDGVHLVRSGHNHLASRVLQIANTYFPIQARLKIPTIDTTFYKPIVAEDSTGRQVQTSWANFGGTSFTLTDGSGTTANGTAVDLGGTLASDSHINMDANQIFFDSGNGVFINNDFKVGDNSTGITSSAVGEFKSTNSGLLIPRMNTSQQNAISGPATGLLIWNTDSLTITQYNGTAWRKLIGTTSGTVTSVATGYGLSGGTITASGTLLVDSATLSSTYLRRKDSTGNSGFATNYQLGLKGNGTIGGSIASTQVAVGSGTNTVSGSSALIYSSGGGLAIGNKITVTANISGNLLAEYTNTNNSGYSGFSMYDNASVVGANFAYCNTGASFFPGSTWIANRQTGDIVFTTSGITERMRILANGSVGIGNTSPVQKLDVAGNSKYSGYSINPPNYATPTTGSTFTTTQTTNIIDPAGTLLALTIALPSSPVDGQLAYYSFSQIITNLSFSGGTLANNVTTASAGSFLHLQYGSTASKWFIQ